MAVSSSVDYVLTVHRLVSEVNIDIPRVYTEVGTSDINFPNAAVLSLDSDGELVPACVLGNPRKPCLPDCGDN